MDKSQVVTGLILPSGELRVDGPVDLAPGRVRVVVTEWPFQAQADDPWTRLEQIWHEQRARHFLAAEAAAADAMKSPPARASVVTEPLSPLACDLRDCMAQLSEDCYCAGWLSDLEYALWSAVMNGPVHKGNWNITQSDIDRLRLLARRAGGWIIWDDSLLATAWLPIDQWLPRYDQYVATHGSNAH